MKIIRSLNLKLNRNNKVEHNVKKIQKFNVLKFWIKNYENLKNRIN